jgi:hypothetical protein
MAWRSMTTSSPSPTTSRTKGIRTPKAPRKAAPRERRRACLPVGQVPQSTIDEARRTGIDQKPYVPESYTCKDFANELEQALEYAGIPATVTIILKYDENDGCRTILRDRDGNPKFFHAITDTHQGDDTGWIEPQTGNETNIDYDGDGSVNTVPRGSIFGGASEGCYAVETFDSWADAQRAYGW